MSDGPNGPYRPEDIESLNDGSDFTETEVREALADPAKRQELVDRLFEGRPDPLRNKDELLDLAKEAEPLTWRAVGRIIWNATGGLIIIGGLMLAILALWLLSVWGAVLILQAMGWL